MPHLSIVIPAYNESERLPDTLALVRDYVERQDFSVEVIVVDDGSKDNTVAIVEEIEERFPNLRLIKNKVNKGKGGVVKQGMLHATGDWRLFIDADNSTPIAELEHLLPFTKDFQVIIGSRYMHPDSIKVKQPWKRRLISRTCNWLIQRSVLPGIIDTQCGFKLFSAEATAKIFPKQTMSGWAFDIEVLTIASHLGYAIKEVPVDWYDAKQSKFGAARGAVRFLRDLRSIWHRARTQAYK